MMVGGIETYYEINALEILEMTTSIV